MENTEEKKKLTSQDICLGLLGILIVISFFAIPIMFLWNDLLPFLTNGQAPIIDYKQAWGLAMLTFCFGRCFSPAG